MYEDDWDADDFDSDDDAADESDDTIPCQNCGRDVYDDSSQCPYCGEYLIHDTNVWSGKSPTTRMLYKFVAILLIAAFLGTGLTLLVRISGCTTN